LEQLDISTLKVIDNFSHFLKLSNLKHIRISALAPDPNYYNQLQYDLMKKGVEVNISCTHKRN